MQQKNVENFVQEWFDELSRHEPVERLLPKIIDNNLEMAFPERTLRSHVDFTDWYGVVGKAFEDQSHVVEKLDYETRGDTVDVALTVVWTATTTEDGKRSAFRVNQEWRLRRDPGSRLRISWYRVGDMTPVPVPGLG
ncbi:hypothetical protein [Streptomyces sp. TS71-3]|uniref:hypothetical protein n=1 Tax=Streptomyces sp. TS71-3 TaxID=2733862 RepID=UPI001B09ECED|nr:hypothetical protein [Streptomyces sp. TS71-3]GHJ39493.1 hypothetical protein Sm713_51020 [Streptomyces sp. TS71-3]